MKALILGATGLLGHTLYRRWSSRPGWSVAGSFRDLPLPGLRHCDLREPGAAESLIRELAPAVVLCPASNPHVDFCETNPEETRAINVDAPLSAARAVARAGGRFVFFSTDYVFDGERESYREEDAPRPLNEYGRQKLAVERGLAESGVDALVLRVTGLFGWEFRRKNFVLQVLRRLGRGESFPAATDQIYRPSYVESLAEALAELVEKGASGTLHLAGDDALDRAQFARAAAEAFDLDPGLIVPVRTPKGPEPGRAPRPRLSVLDCAKAASLLGRPLPGARADLMAMSAAAADWESYAESLLGGSFSL